MLCFNIKESASLVISSVTSRRVMLDDDISVQVSYLISAWARMCKILGDEFEQYLPMVMPPVLKAASIKPEVRKPPPLSHSYRCILQLHPHYCTTGFDSD